MNFLNIQNQFTYNVEFVFIYIYIYAHTHNSNFKKISKYVIQQYFRNVFCSILQILYDKMSRSCFSLQDVTGEPKHKPAVYSTLLNEH